MLALRPVKLFLIMVLIVGLFPVIGWAEGPVLLTDEDMDGIYARGIWVNFDINITLPGGNMLSVPSISIPDISKPGNVGSVPGNTQHVSAVKPSVATPPTTSTTTSTNTANNTANSGTGQISPSGVSGVNSNSNSPANTVSPGTGQTNPSVVSGENTSSPASTVSPVYQFDTPGSGIVITDNAMQGNSGMIINAPNSAVSLSISVVVLNNSTVTGDIFQSSNSYPTNLFLSMKSYMH